MKTCKICNLNRDVPFHGNICIDCFNKLRRRKSISIRMCKKCKIEKEICFKSRYCNECKKLSHEEIILKEQEYGKKYYYKYRDQILERLHDNKDKIRIKRNLYKKNRLKYDRVFKIQYYISNSIRMFLKKIGSSKNNKSILDYLPYTIIELKQHLENQFESWMNWNNYGVYHINTWKNNDQSTWTWNIDHIIPQSKLPYTSMEDDNFKKCWALENLRPLSSKDNSLKHNKLVV